MSAILNIGLNIGDGKRTIPSRAALAALILTGADVLAHEVRQSNTEGTLIATVRQPLPASTLHGLAVTLQQEAIAQHDGTTGELYGPAADVWRPFNPAFFLVPQQAPEYAAA